MDVSPAALNAIIPNGASRSNDITIPFGRRVYAIVTPAAWTTAVLEFEISYDNGQTYALAYQVNGTTVLSLASAAIAGGVKTVLFDGALTDYFDGVGRMRLKSGTGAGTNQAAERVIKVIVGS